MSQDLGVQIPPPAPVFDSMCGKDLKPNCADRIGRKRAVLDRNLAGPKSCQWRDEGKSRRLYHRKTPPASHPARDTFNLKIRDSVKVAFCKRCKIAKIAKILVLVGPRSKFIAEGALESGFKQKDLYSFDSSKTAAKFMAGAVEKGDLILVKGSQGVRLERVVEAIMAHPELKDTLLCRQEKEWQNR